MKLEKQRDEELSRRKGLAGRTIIQLIWLAISAGLGYLLTNSLVEADIINYARLRNLLGIPSTVSNPVMQGVIIFLIVAIMQFVLFLIFAWFTPEGRRKPGTASMHSRYKDPFDDRY